MQKKVVACFAFISALALVGASNAYKVDLYQPTVVNGTTFKAGEVKLELKANQVSLKQGKTTAESPVKIENGTNKFNATSVGYTEAGRIQEIRLGGTNTKLVFEGTDATTSTAAH